MTDKFISRCVYGEVCKGSGPGEEFFNGLGCIFTIFQCERRKGCRARYLNNVSTVSSALHIYFRGYEPPSLAFGRGHPAQKAHLPS